MRRTRHAMRVLATKFPDVIILEPKVFPDERGFFKEVYSQGHYAQAGITDVFIQDNLSYSKRYVLRGMHYDFRMAKLVQALTGRVFDAFVDMREDSPTYKQWDSVELSAENHRQVYLPPGFAHGFLVLSEDAFMLYKQTALYDPPSQRAISWRDESIGIQWPLGGVQPVLSEQDAAL